MSEPKAFRSEFAVYFKVEKDQLVNYSSQNSESEKDDVEPVIREQPV